VPDPSLIDLLRQAGCTDEVIAHCKAVRDLALTFASDDLVDRDLLETGALLHDIGRGKTHGLNHAEVGGAVCRSFGLQDAVASIVERHIGAGMTADECSLLDLTPRDCIPSTLEERIVAHADNLVKGDRTITIQERMQRSIGLPRRLRRRMFRLYLEMELLK
jgi:uncharacterized protein